jgi:hypothetical protein
MSTIFYVISQSFFLLCYNALSYAANLLWAFRHGLIIPRRTVLAASEDPQWCRLRVRTDNVPTPPSTSPPMVRATLSINVPTFGTVSQNRRGGRADGAIRESS